MHDFALILPEAIITLTLAFVIAAEITYHGERVRLVAATALLGLFAAFTQTIITYQYGATEIFGRTLAIDGLSLFFKLLFITQAALAVFASIQTREITRGRKTEYVALILASTLAMCLAASASEILLAFLTLQSINVLAFFLAGYGKRSVLSTEAAVKYMAFGGLAAALFLYGLAILFSFTHAFNIYEIHQALVATPLSYNSMLVVFTLIFMALSFQFGAFPMHFWTPDVLEGAPTPAAAFLSFGGRAAGFAVALRFVIVMFAQPSQANFGPAEPGQWQVLGALDWTNIVALVSGTTMLVGSLLATQQKAAKRMVGCLVIAESGFLLLGLLVLDQVGVAALLYNLVVELFALMGAYYVIAFIFDEIHSDQLTDMKGMLQRAVPECICLVLFLLCLVGLPPMPGFVGKFALVGAVVRHHWIVLGIIAIMAMTLSTVAIARLAYHLVGDYRMPAAAPVVPNFQRNAFLAVLVVPMVLVGVFAEFVLDWAGKSLGFILW